MNIVAIVAHPDDEIIGMGGTLLKHKDLGDTVSVVVLAENKSSRVEQYEHFDPRTLDAYDDEMRNAHHLLGVSSSRYLKLPNNRMDRMELLDVAKLMEAMLSELAPQIVYTHFFDDLNIDHSVTCRAVLTAARALPGAVVKEIYMCETLSSTEQALATRRAFCPNLFVDISQQEERKYQAMACYVSELRDPPHARSLELIQANARVWGAKCGVQSAEAFEIARILR